MSMSCCMCEHVDGAYLLTMTHMHSLHGQSGHESTDCTFVSVGWKLSPNSSSPMSECACPAIFGRETADKMSGTTDESR